MAVTPDVIAKARSFIGTPFKHMGRIPGEGLDCIGLIQVTLHECGLLLDKQTGGYGRAARPGMLIGGLEDTFQRVNPSEMREGDIILFSITSEPQHVAWYTGDDTFIHAYALTPRRVTEQRLNKQWRTRIRGVFRVRELRYVGK